MKTFLFIIFYFLSLSFIYADSYIPSGQGEEATLAMGYNPDTQKFVGSCLKGKAERHGKQEANLSFSQTLSQSSLQKELGMDAGTRFKYGAATVKASAKFLNSTKSSGFSIAAVYSGDYKFKNKVLVFEEQNIDSDLEIARLSQVGASVRQDDTKWSRTCGSEYVAQIERGAKLFYSIKIEFMTSEEKDLFEAAFNYDSSYANVSAHLKKSQANFSKRTSVTVGALQIGGDVRKITQLFVSDSEFSGNAALGFVKCSFGDLSKCDQVMANAIRYATRDFKKQLEESPDNPHYEGGPASIRYITKPYSSAGIYNKFSSVMNASISQKRKEIENHFDIDMNYLNQVNSILMSPSVITSKRQKDLLKSESKKLEKNISLMIKAAETCYNIPERCPDEATVAINSRVEYHRNSLVIEPEEFRQFCALADSVLATTNLRESIHGMVSAAKELDKYAFSEDSVGVSDDCLQSHMVFARNTKVHTFKNKQISTLEPLKQYTHFESLDFSNNKIEDLLPIKTWHRLNELIAKNNHIRDVSILASLPSLRNLTISNNRLRTIEKLKENFSLVRIDARNNFAGVSCKDFKNEVNCLSASIQTEANFSPLSTRVSSPLFIPTVTTLTNGEIIITGNGEYAQRYNPKQNKFYDLPKNKRKSFEREATLLKDGRILLSGGWLSQKTLVLINPETNTVEHPSAQLNVPRVGHKATRLMDGRVLITGGWEGGGTWTGSNPTNTVEIFNPKTGQTTLTSSLHAPRAWHTATLLKNGKVLIAGGFSYSGGIATAELFDPVINKFIQLPVSMLEGRAMHTATELPSGDVLLTGGFGRDNIALSEAEIYSISHKRFIAILEPLNQRRAMHAAVLLKNGMVLITGGSLEILTPDRPLEFSPETVLDHAELFDPVENSFIEVPSNMYFKRARHKMVETKEGTVLLIGGMSWGSITSLEVFNYINLPSSDTNIRAQ